MYIPKSFAREDLPSLHGLIRERPLGTWVVQDQRDLIVNHVPFMLDPQRGPYGTLIGHVARANPVWRRVGETPSVVVFHGAQAYVSPAWYASKQTDGQVVPTWNYVVVHAHGVPAITHDKARLLGIVTALTDVHEVSSEHPWRVSDAPEEYIDKLLTAIVGIEIQITRLEGKWKVSQNRSTDDQRGVSQGMRALHTAEHDEMATLVESYLRITP